MRAEAEIFCFSKTLENALKSTLNYSEKGNVYRKPKPSQNEAKKGVIPA